jgi:hypothetical protein
MIGAMLVLCAFVDTVHVATMAEFQGSLRSAKPGTTILIAPGTYEGGVYAENLRGTREQKIVIRGADPGRRPQFTNWHLSKVSHLEISHIQFVGSRSNGLNIDDGGRGPASHHIRIHNVTIADLPKGNHDGIKLSGVEDFSIEDSYITRWGGSGIDMVGCHRGTIERVNLRDGGDNGVQAKGGTSDIKIRKCWFANPGQRGVNLGGSTGLEFFRPLGAKYEAKNLTVEGCVFDGGVAAVAFVGVDGATVRFNTIHRPERWAFRILQETTAPGFVPCRNGRFEDNLVIFSSDRWASGGVNVGANTAPTTFRFARNHWFCTDRPSASRPQLPTTEMSAIYGIDPLYDPANGQSKSRAGAGAFRD